MPTESDILAIADDVVARARAAGADAADAVAVAGTALGVSRRLGKPQSLERSESTDLGLRVFVGNRQAIASTSDFAPDSLDEVAARALAMARSVPDDPFCGLADPELLAIDIAELDIAVAGEPATDTLVDWARRAEDAALAVDGVTNSEGADASWAQNAIALAASNGFAKSYERSRCSISVAVLAGEGTAMERDYDFFNAVCAEDLPDPESLGRAAGDKAVRRLNPRKAQSARLPVVYDPRVARGVLSHLAGAINGASVARGTTFLKDRLEEAVMPASITVVDDPLRRRGLRSRPFDGEGVAQRRFEVVQGGVLTTWILDSRSARQIGMQTTGHATRGTSSPPSPSATNLYLEAGDATPAELMADIQAGLYVTEMIGFGVNTLTGDYSRGASGFWIENGTPGYPVSEITVAGNLKDMLMNVRAANDLEFRYGTDSPTLRIEGMTIGGQ
ncbi:MAG: metallopeptidase TldD-related protein [Rhodospirillales bacterium]|jgi:PmbA protein|nr:metallopeptidase TldD-related protein [Rhodospirillales bacterium]MDP6804033.1 metallopeptidase TldD-related protein [Rhodospirillales bacterium]